MEEAQATLEWAARPLTGLRAELRAVPCTSVSRGLQEVAADEGALAIVVGPSHRGPSAGSCRAASARRLLHGAPCPVAVAPSGFWTERHTPIRRSASATWRPGGRRGTPRGGRTRRRHGRADSRARRRRAGRGHCGGTTGTGLCRARGAHARRPARRRCVRRSTRRHRPGRDRGDVVDGYADDELARLSEDVDLLVCGSRGHSPLGSVMLGSVSAGVLRKARSPVLVVPRGARDGFAALGARTPAAA